MQAIMTEIVTITPELAREWLEKRNVGNRSISEKLVALYAADMRDGNWPVNGQAVVFDDTGRMIDGHHRVTAAAKHNVPFTSLVVRGVPAESVKSMDLGRPRGAGDIAEMQGVKDANRSVAVARLLLIHERGGINAAHVNTRLAPTKLQQVEALKRFPEIAESMKTCWDCRALMPGAVTGFCYVVCHRHNREKASSFFRKLASGEGLIKGDPVLALRNRLVSDRRLKIGEQIHLVFRAYLAHAEGRTAKHIPIMDTFPRVWGGVE